MAAMPELPASIVVPDRVGVVAKFKTQDAGRKEDPAIGDLACDVRYATGDLVNRSWPGTSPVR